MKMCYMGLGVLQAGVLECCFVRMNKGREGICDERSSLVNWQQRRSYTKSLGADISHPLYPLKLSGLLEVVLDSTRFFKKMSLRVYSCAGLYS